MRRGTISLSSLVLCLVLVESPGVAQSSGAITDHAPDREHSAHLPLVFEPASHNSQEFLTRRNGLEARFARSEITFLLSEHPDKVATVNLRLLGRTQDAVLSAENQLQSQSNYLIGSDPSQWRTHVPNFRRIRYSGVYPGIDLLFYGTGSNLEHDFVISPGGDPQQIAFNLLGGRTQITKDGELQVKLEGATMVFKRPVAYQQTARGRTFIPAMFRRSARAIGFKIGAYDRTRELVIDPVLTFSTYLANLLMNPVGGVATDAVGNTYITGLDFSPNFPVTPGAYQTVCNSCSQAPDVFVTKLSADGTSLVYSTFLGGNSYDEPFGISVDANGNAVVAGRTESNDFPVKNSVPHGPAAGGFYGFVASLSADGSSLNYSSLLGGAPQPGIGSTTIVNGVALDAQGNAYIAGTTDSSYLSATPGALNNVTPAYPKEVAFVSKFLSGGAPGSLAYTALVGDTRPQNGGGGLIGVTGIAVDSSGDAHITGNAGTLWPTTPGAYQTTIAGTAPYAAVFVAKFSSDASQLVYSTFVGNDDGSRIGIALDQNGDAFITGGTVSPTFPTTANAYLRTLPPGSCCFSFLSELDPTGSMLLYSSFIGSGSALSFNTYTVSSHIAIDGSENLWLAGYTTDQQFPLVNPLQSSPASSSIGGVRSGFVSMFDPTGQTLTFSTLFGDLISGGEVDGVAVDTLGRAHIAGVTGQALYTTPNAYVPEVTPPPPNVYGIYVYAAGIDVTVPAPAACSTGSIYFGLVPVNTTRNAAPVAITNCGDGPLNISSLVASASFAETDNCVGTTSPGSSCQVTVSFTPPVKGNITGTLVINDDVQIGPKTIVLSGTGAQPSAHFFSSQLTLDSMLIGETSPAVSEFIENTGDASLLISGISTSGDFTAAGSSCTAGPILPGHACRIDVTFTPTAEGLRTGALVVATNDPDHESVSIPLSGTGWTAYPVPAITAITPDFFEAGSGDTTVQIYGAGFTFTTTASLDGRALSTTFVKTSQLSVTIPAESLASYGEPGLTLTTPAAPGGGTSNPFPVNVYLRLKIHANHMVFDPYRRLLFASINASATANSNLILPIDPATGNFGAPLDLGHVPSALAISDDGQFLYAGIDNAVQQYSLAAGSMGVKTVLGGVSPNYLYSALQIRTAPGSPHRFGVLAGLTGTYSNIVRIYDDDQMQGQAGGPEQNPGWIFFLSSPDIIYGTGSITNLNFFEFDLTSSELLLTKTVPNPAGNYDYLIGNDTNYVYSAAGKIYDPDQNVIVGTYPLTNITRSNAFAVALDSSLARTFYLGDYYLAAFDQNSLEQTFAAGVPNGPQKFDFLRWGTDGFAFLSQGFNGSDLILMRNSALTSSAASNPVPTTRRWRIDTEADLTSNRAAKVR